MRRIRNLPLLLCLSAPAPLIGSPAAAQDVPSAHQQELATLKEQLAAAREELATEHARSQQLQTRLVCTEELLEGYQACGELHDAESQPYWECVQGALAVDDKCQNAQAQNDSPGR